MKIEMENGATPAPPPARPFRRPPNQREEEKNRTRCAKVSLLLLIPLHVRSDIIAMGKESGDQIQMDGTLSPEGRGPWPGRLNARLSFESEF